MSATSSSQTEAAKSIKHIVEKLRDKPGALLPLLHAVQDEFGYISPEVLPVIADALNLSRAEVHGVVSFYHYFRSSPPGRNTIQICRAESCQAMGGRELEAHAKQSLQIDYQQTTADGELTLLPVYCLGNCACSPAVRVGNKIYGQVDPVRFDEIVSGLSSSDEVGGQQLDKTAQQTTKPLIKIFVPRDTTSCSLGADLIADTIQQGIKSEQLPLQMVRNGSRGLYWLEPMIEFETEQGRVAYGPVTPEKIDKFVAERCWEKSEQERQDHPLYLGLTEDIEYLKKQQRLTFARVGVVDPNSVEDYCSQGGFTGLKKALSMKQQAIVSAITDSGLRGRGGAAFPTGIKWQTVLDVESAQKYIVCNADEGDSGNYADRMLMESDPFSLIEGMVIAGLAVGADRGYIYLREEYPLACEVLNKAIDSAIEQAWLGDNIAGSGKCFNMEVRLGAGAYICGEETSMLESIEGKRGEVRPKPPLPAIKGLFGKPSVINNVISLATVPIILAQGAEHYKSYGQGRSLGTLPFQLAGNIKQPGLVELAFGSTLKTLLVDFGGGTRTGEPMKAVQVGGPLGAYLPEGQWNTPLDYEAFNKIDAMLGHGGVVAFDNAVDMSVQARFAMEFCTIESCGKCTPCRIGSVRGVEVIDKIRAGEDAQQNTILLKDLCDTMVHGSLCAMGGMTPYPVRSALRYFTEDFDSSANSSIGS
jgi:formate dehydrogenase iron-sulfur subunit